MNKVKDSTYNNLRHLINDQDICIVSVDKGSCVVILKRTDYINKLETMINKGIKSGTYAECEDKTTNDLKLFQDFLRRKIKSYEKYEKRDQFLINQQNCLLQLKPINLKT